MVLHCVRRWIGANLLDKSAGVVPIGCKRSD